MIASRGGGYAGKLGTKRAKNVRDTFLDCIHWDQTAFLAREAKLDLADAHGRQATRFFGERRPTIIVFTESERSPRYVPREVASAPDFLQISAADQRQDMRLALADEVCRLGKPEFEPVQL